MRVVEHRRLIAHGEKHSQPVGAPKCVRLAIFYVPVGSTPEQMQKGYVSDAMQFEESALLVMT